MRVSRMAVLLVAPLALAAQQHDHSAMVAAQAKTAEMSHHAFLEMERGAIERGEGFGMALAADRNGFPGPKHILELKTELGLTAEQQAGVEKLMAEMREKAVAKGREILDAEKKLEEMFAAGRAERELRTQTNRIAEMRGELRWVHLATHVAARKVLTAGQNAKYQELRHGAGGQSD